MTAKNRVAQSATATAQIATILMEKLVSKARFPASPLIKLS
jgi:hypothetical protein